MIIYEGTACPPEKGYIAIVVSKFNRTITQRLLDGALATLRKHKVHEEDVRVSWVPGAFEIPLIARRFADHEECRAVICLGAVIRGETSHDEHINRAVSLEIAKIATETGKPAVMFGNPWPELDCVYPDKADYMRRTVAYLVGRGYREIGFIGMHFRI